MITYTAAPLGTPETSELFIAHFFEATTSGFFLDIGAFDGVICSNTRRLWDRGWSGLLIEPDPVSFARLVANYPDHSRVKLLNAAVSTKSGLLAFYQHTDPVRAGWHSSNPDWVATWPTGTRRRIVVRSVQFSELELPPVIDLLSIDTEGSDADILESMPESVRPRLIVCEVDKYLVRERVDQEMARRGYGFVWGNYLDSAFVPRL